MNRPNLSQDLFSPCRVNDPKFHELLIYLNLTYEVCREVRKTFYHHKNFTSAKRNNFLFICLSKWSFVDEVSGCCTILQNTRVRPENVGGLSTHPCNMMVHRKSPTWGKGTAANPAHIRQGSVNTPVNTHKNTMVKYTSQQAYKYTGETAK